jgi:hypothetical protein
VHVQMLQERRAGARGRGYARARQVARMGAEMAKRAARSGSGRAKWAARRDCATDPSAAHPNTHLPDATWQMGASWSWTRTIRRPSSRSALGDWHSARASPRGPAPQAPPSCGPTTCGRGLGPLSLRGRGSHWLGDASCCGGTCRR